METIETESTEMETTDLQTSNQDDQSTGSAANGTLDSAANDSPDEAMDQNSDDHSEGNSDEQPPASQQHTSKQEATRQEATDGEAKKDQARNGGAKNGGAKNGGAKNGGAKKVAGLSLNPSTAGTQTGNPPEKKPSLQTRLAREQASKQYSSRKKKLIRYTVGAVVLVGIGMYFYHQIQSLVAAKATSLPAPSKIVRIDSTAQQVDPPTKSYELEAKNHYQDSLNRAIRKDALSHISMDWGRLYNVDNYDPKRKESQASKQPDTALNYEEKSLYDLLSKEIGNHQADSLALEQKRLAAIRAKGSTTTGATATGNAAGFTAASGAKKGSSVSGPATQSRTGKSAHSNGLAQSTTRQPSENSLFNVIHGSSSSVEARGSKGNSGSGNYSSGNRSETVTDAGAEPVVVRAVVHGNHKVASGSKVAFRLLEGVSFQGIYFEKNTILIGIATFRNGRVNFSDFRSKSLSSVSASHGEVASTALPMVCYDTDMVVGIPVSDQSPVETQTRQAGTSALSDAANDVSYSIPYGSLARAASSLTRGVASGKRQQREKFIDLADNYPVLLELMPPKEK
jgi:hypothetical protein